MNPQWYSGVKFVSGQAKSYRRFLGKTKMKHHRPDKGNKDKISIRKDKTQQQVYIFFKNSVAYQGAADGQWKKRLVHLFCLQTVEPYFLAL